jgi:DNA polymerase-3 subunit beta
MDAVSVIPGEEILFKIGVGLKPSVIKPTEGDNCLCIVMPLKI